MEQSKPLTLNKHDIKVIAFHIGVAMILAALTEFGKINFGIYTSTVAVGIQVISEALRRFING